MIYTHDSSTDSLLASAAFLNGLLITATAAAGGTVLVKFVAHKDPLKPDVVKVFGVDVPIGRAWILFLAFTVGHLYVAYVFIHDCIGVLKKSADVRADAWQSLQGGNLLFFHGLIARLKFDVVGGHKVYFMDQSDPTTWLVHGIAILTFVAITRVVKVSWSVRLGTLAAAFLIVFINWIIGTNWVVRASLLATN